jgi:hypothetical protein
MAIDDRGGGDDIQTPRQGVPRALTNEPDTGRLSRALHGELVAANIGGMPPSGNDVLDLLAAKLAPRLNERTERVEAAVFLGLGIGAWTRMALGVVGAALIAVATWYLTLRDELRVRPTVPQVEEALRESFDHHNDSSIQLRLGTLSEEQQIIRESQVRQEGIDETQTKTLDRIERKLDRRSK